VPLYVVLPCSQPTPYASISAASSNTYTLQAVFVMDFNWKTTQKPKITYVDSVANGRIALAKKAAQALIHWTVKELEREHSEDKVGAGAPVPEKLQV